MKICLAGVGAFAKKHLDALARIDGVNVVSLVGRQAESTEAVAAQYGIARRQFACWAFILSSLVE